MLLSEVAQKNRRLKSWDEAIKKGALSPVEKQETIEVMAEYNSLLVRIVQEGANELGLVPEQFTIKLQDLERKLEQLAESARLESGKSKLL